MNVVVFTLNGREYGGDIAEIHSVRRYKGAVPVPDVIDYVEGVISLENRVVPLVNLRKKWGLPPQAEGKQQRMMIVNIQGHLIGFLVDSVAHVLPVQEGEIAPPDEILKEAHYLSGVVRKDDRLILLVDLKKLINAGDRTHLDAVHARVEIRGNDGA